MMTMDNLLLRILIEGAIVGAMCSLLGGIIILRGMSFISVGIAHSAFAGAALGYLLGFHPFGLALVFSIASSILVGSIVKSTSLRIDTPIGIMFSFTMALAILFISLMKGYDTRVMGLLFGDILGVGWEDTIAGGIILIITVGFFLYFYKEIASIIFNEELASASGIHVTLINNIFLVILATAIVLSLKAVGVILLTAQLVIPPATAYQLTHRFSVMLILSCIIGVLGAVGGIIISALWNIPSGASIVLFLSALFFIISLIPTKK